MVLLGEVCIFHQVSPAVEFVDALHEGELDPGRVGGPVATAGDEHHGTGGAEGRDLGIVGDVMGAHVDGHAALASASAVKVGGDHDAWSGCRDAIIEGGEQEGLGAAAGGPRDAHASGVDPGQGEHEVDGPDAVPALQAQDLIPVIVIPALLAGIRIADHVIGKNSSPHAGKGGAAVLHLRAEAALLGVVRVPGVAVGAEDGRHTPGRVGGQVEISAEEEAGSSFKGDVLDGVSRVAAP